MDIHYRFKIDRWAIRLFAIIMIPNIIWSLTAGPQDALMVESRTPVCDIIGSIFQVLMLASLILLQRENRPSPMPGPMKVSTIILTGGYLLCWVSHFAGFTPLVFILAMAVLPCLAFGAFAIGRKNYLAAAFCTIFTVCHICFAIMSY